MSEKDEVKVAEKDGRAYKLARPFTYEGVTYEEITLDFSKLSGRDLIDCENQLSSSGTILTKEVNQEYQALVAAKAANLHHHVITALPAQDFIQITKRAQRFLLKLA
ncbi:phage tail assembly protein [Paenibacillus sp. FSL R5-0810]|uniref:phage tail assembly protein n=1 Tax=Paenibacillus sp. FSL R5-0810 TaxID=2921659 RepID=UPI0030F57CFD